MFTRIRKYCSTYYDFEWKLKPHKSQTKRKQNDRNVFWFSFCMIPYGINSPAQFFLRYDWCYSAEPSPPPPLHSDSQCALYGRYPKVSSAVFRFRDRCASWVGFFRFFTLSTIDANDDSLHDLSRPSYYSSTVFLSFYWFASLKNLALPCSPRLRDLH